MRSLAWVSFVTLGLAGAGCDNNKSHAHPEAGPDSPAVDPWWQPEPGEARNWDVQVAAPYDLTAQRAMYVLDLWALAAATSLDYGDGDPVAVPAGALAGKIAELHASTTVVVCRVRTGAIRLGDPDARKFPGFEASPPDRPTAPAAGSVIGWSTTDPEERFLDIRAASRASWEALIWKRLDLAKQLGCDAVEADRNDMITSDPGFAIPAADQLSWYEEVARQAHQRELSVGMKNGTTLGIVGALADDYDWLLVERCAEFDDCDRTQEFTRIRKAVFAIDYENDVDGLPQPSSALCNRISATEVDGLVKDDALSSTFREQCTP